MHITCPFCGAMNEATVFNDYIGSDKDSIIGPVWQCNICDEAWTDDTAENILEQQQR